MATATAPATAMALVLAGVAAIVAAAVLARYVPVPAPVLLVLAGVGYALLPGRNVHLDPDVVLYGVIPPLLYSAALDSSAIALRGRARTVAGLSVGLVLATAVAVGAAVSAVVPAVPLAAGIALGAAVAPPDPVAALAVGRRAGLPPRLVTLVEGEGLLNDATALTTLKVAVAAAVGGSFSLTSAAGRFLLAAAGGVGVGWAVAVVLSRVRGLVRDALVENALSLATPFTAYLLAEQLHVSGVLAVVVTGLYVGHHAASRQSSDSRLQIRPVWRLVTFLLEGFVFLLIGTQLPAVVRGLDAYPGATVTAATAVTLAVVLLVRPVWLLASSRLPARLHTRLGGEAGTGEPLSGRELVAMSWVGTRGVISLAAVFSLPLTVDDGSPFPGRDLLLFCTYVVVLGTLLGQGLTFAPLLRRLRLGSTELDEALVRNQARVAAVDASLQRLRELLVGEPQPAELVAVLRSTAEARRERYARRIAMLEAADDDEDLPVDDGHRAAGRLRRGMIEAEREELLEWRDTGRLPDRSLRLLQRQLDHEESMLPPG